MKPSPRWFVAALSITVATAALTISMRLKAQNQAAQGHHHYKLIDLGTFGGALSSEGLFCSETIEKSIWRQSLQFGNARGFEPLPKSPLFQKA